MPKPAGISPPETLRLQLACALTEVRRAARATRVFLIQAGCAEDDIVACELALVEGCNNAINYAAPGRAGEPVIIEVDCRPDEVEMRVTDHTAGFDLPGRIDLPDPDVESGRGLYLIHSLMDSVQYCRRDTENVLVLRKTRQPIRPV
jgi:serine/threonine-protein kinase RsbW